MLSDKELEQDAAQLTDFRSVTTKHQETLSTILEKYTALTEEYKRLKSDYEEERDARERYKQMARGQERSPFVLVLIDGDGYVFDDDLVSAGPEDGQRAAQLLNGAIQRSLRSRGLEDCKVMVRVYANLVGLSKVLSRHKLCGAEKRSLAPFTANFSRANALFDFVDAGELKENADSKIRALLLQFADNAQCKHVYFGGCHDVGYVNDLQQYAGSDRITLIRIPAFHAEFGKLGLRVEELPNIFRSTPLDDQVFYHKQNPSKTITPPLPQQPADATAGERTALVCPFYQKGLCKYGSGCRFLHIKQTATGSSKPGLDDVRKWRENTTSNDDGAIPFRMSNVAKTDNDFMSGHSSTPPSGRDQPGIATSLPPADSIPPRMIPVNKNKYRLDAYIPPPSPADRAAFNARCAVQKLCNNYFLKGGCSKSYACDYDHKPAAPEVINCLKQVVTNNPCPRKGECRLLTCLNGHICQKADCKFRGGKVFCKFSMLAHNQELKVEAYVPGIGPKGGDERDEDLLASPGARVAGNNGWSTTDSSDDNEDADEERDEQEHRGSGITLRDLKGEPSLD